MSPIANGTGPAGVATFTHENRVMVTASKDIVKSLATIYGKLKTHDYNNSGLQDIFDRLCRGRSPSDAWHALSGLTILCNDVTEAMALKQSMIEQYRVEGLVLLNVR